MIQQGGSGPHIVATISNFPNLPKVRKKATTGQRSEICDKFGERPPGGVEKAVQAATSSCLVLSVSTLFKRLPSAYCIPLKTSGSSSGLFNFRKCRSLI